MNTKPLTGIRNYFLKTFGKPTREEIIETVINERLNDIFQFDFTNKEIGHIVNRISAVAKERLKSRQELIEQDLKDTINAINKL